MSFAAVNAAIWIVVSQCMAALEGTEAGAQLRLASTTTKPSGFSPSFSGDYLPTNTQVWAALMKAGGLPPKVARKAKLVRTLNIVSMGIWAGCLVMILTIGFWPRG